MNLITENKAGIPVFMSSASGNTQDKKGFRDFINRQIVQLQQAEITYLIADSALYSAESLRDFDQHQLKWITRVPETSLDAMWALEHADASQMSPLQDGYRYMVIGNRYADIKQRWLIVHSQSKQAREEKKVLKKLQKKPRRNLRVLKKSRKKYFFAKKMRSMPMTIFVKNCSMVLSAIM